MKRTYIQIKCPVCNKERTIRRDGIGHPLCKKCASTKKWENSSYAKKCSDSHIGYVMPEEQREKIAKANTGKSTKAWVLKGESHYNWKGGVTPEIRKHRNSLNYKLWRRSCLERDCFTCQISGRIGGCLVVHHLNNFSKFPELRYELRNGVTIARELHNSFHSKYGFNNNTIEQFIEFNKIYEIDTMGSRQIGTK